MASHLVRNPQNGSNAVAARRRGLATAAMGCDWSIAAIPVVERPTFGTKHHGTRPAEAPYG